jgi:hypothetical protein
MSDLRDKYLCTLGLEKDDLATKRQTKAALTRAYQLRTFEIEHYWKRATYFWGFQVAIFAAFGLLWKATPPSNDWGPVTVALVGLGVLTACANSLSAGGSKFWQQNWELHIDMLEDEIEGRLHKTVWLPEGKVSFSVSRINQKLSNYFVVFWVIVALYVMWKFLELGVPSLGWLSPARAYVLVVVIMVMFGVIWLYCQTTDFRGTLPKLDGSHGGSIKRCCPWCKRIREADSPTFIRRYAPGEEASQ